MTRPSSPGTVLSRALGAAACCLVLAVAGCSTSSSHPSTGRAPAGVAHEPAGGAGQHASLGAPSAVLRPDRSWRVTSWAPPAELGGYVSPSSTLPGGPLHLHLRGTHPQVHVQVFRSGWYGGAGAALVETLDVTVRPPGRPVLLDAARRTWTAAWPESTTLDTRGWEPGHYLVLASAAGHQTWVPFTVTSPVATGRVVVVAENTTWQAYNAWGGASLYHGRDGARRTRAYAVSHDRPLDYGDGAGDYSGNELPLLELADRLGLPLAFATDTDLASRPGLLDGARAVLSLGHDEYWSSAMRAQLLHARDATGTNLAFFGANAVYRHIRLEPLDGVPDRIEVNYKSSSLDPVSRTDPAEATSDWPSGPHPDDGKQLTGGAYQCNPVHTDLVLSDPTAWFLAGLDLPAGTRLPGLVGSEYDKVVPGGDAPADLVSLARSPLRCDGRRDHADIAYYTVPSGAAGLDIGTSAWVCVLDDVCGGLPVTARERQIVTAITTNVLRAFAAGPAGRLHPAML